MIFRVSTLLSVCLFFTACEEGEILPGVSVPDEGSDSKISLTRSVPTSLYVGVTHQLTLDAGAGDASDLKVTVGRTSTASAQLTRSSSSLVEVVATQPGDLILEVEDAEGNELGPFPFQAKRIPDPVARLGNLESGSVLNGEFRAQSGVIAWLDDFDFDARCDIAGFELVYHAKRTDPVPVTNQGAQFSSNSQILINRAAPGDYYIFNNVRALCPGDPATRRINALVFRIK